MFCVHHCRAAASKKAAIGFSYNDADESNQKAHAVEEKDSSDDDNEDFEDVDLGEMSMWSKWSICNLFIPMWSICSVYLSIAYNYRSSLPLLANI